MYGEVAMNDLEAALLLERALAQDAADALETCGRRLDALAAQNLIRNHQLDALAAERDRLAAVVRDRDDEIAAFRDAAAREREALHDERDALIRERDALIVERDTQIRERDELAASHAELAAALDALHARLAEPRYVVADRVSRALKPLGPVKSVLRHLALTVTGGARSGSSR